MKFLKGLGTFICSFLLFVSLSVFSIAFLLHSTLLSPDFVTSQVDKIDISAVSRDIIEKQVVQDIPQEVQFLKDVTYDVINQQEPWLKKQMDAVINTGYDFLLGKSDQLKITIPLEELKANLKDSLWQTSRKYLEKELAGLSQDQIKQYLQELVGEIAEEDLPPELARLPRNQLNTYIEQYLRQFGGQKPTVSLPPEVTRLLEDQLKKYFDRYCQELDDQIPDDYTIDESSIPADAMEQLLLARKYIGYFKTGYYLLIVFMVFLAGLIFLINRNVRDTTRSLGVDLIVFGILELAGALLMKYIDFLSFIPDIPTSIVGWLNSLYKDVASIIQVFSIVILVVGVALLVVSFVVKPRAAED
jgi:hypothetical protein